MLFSTEPSGPEPSLEAWRNLSQSESSLELGWALEEAETIFLPKGRLAPYTIQYLGQMGICTPPLLEGVGEIQNSEGREFVFVPDNAIGELVRDTPHALGLTGTHQLIENRSLYGSFSIIQTVMTLWQSRFALVVREEEEPETFLERIDLSPPLHVCTEYPETTQLLMDQYGIPAKIEHVKSGLSEITLRRFNNFSAAAVITETTKTIGRSRLAIGLDHLAPVELSVVSNMSLNATRQNENGSIVEQR